MGLRLEPIPAAANENQKTLATFTHMLDELKRVDPLRRSEPVLAVGGGVLTDTAGFACACWRRGIPWCRLPTTLLGMVDASVGIKVAINYHRKNGTLRNYGAIRRNSAQFSELHPPTQASATSSPRCTRSSTRRSSPPSPPPTSSRAAARS